jgi:voltage-gated potassium channel
LLAAPFLFDLSVGTERAILAADWMIWALFAAEFVVKTYLAPDRRRYVVTHRYDLILVVVPFLRPLRVVRSLRALRALRLARLVSAFARVWSVTRDVLTTNGLQYALAIGGLLVVAAAFVVWRLERDSGNIDDFGTALWWAATTVTTVGYGDAFPETAAGRGVAVFLMIVGITLFGILTASLASFFVRAEERTSFDDVMRELELIREQLERLDRSDVGGAPTDSHL